MLQERLNPPREADFIGHTPDISGIQTTLVLRRRQPLEAVSDLTHDNLTNKVGSLPEDVESVTTYCKAFGLEIVDRNNKSRTITLEGSADQYRAAFNVDLHDYRSLETNEQFVACSHEPSLPEGAIALLGLDERPVAKSNITSMRSEAVHEAHFVTHNNTYNPIDLAKLYDFPEDYNGDGQTIAIIELGGGYMKQNFMDYFHRLGRRCPYIESINVDGARNHIGTAADGEVQLDVEVAGAMASGAKYAVYFAPNSDRGFHNAIAAAIHDTGRKPSVISISWGSPENHWNPWAMKAMEEVLAEASALGIAVTAAAGDHGAADGERRGMHADFPASSPSVIACGGTKLIANSESISLEAAWNERGSGRGATGGGISQTFPKPAWQADDRVPLAPNGFVGRGVPDVAAVADPVTGYYVRVNGQDQIVGGTSAVAPLWAALIARVYQAMGKRIPYLNKRLYWLKPEAFRDITQGGNNGYKAGDGWDPTTGLGSPVGSKLLKGLKELDARDQAACTVPNK